MILIKRAGIQDVDSIADLFNLYRVFYGQEDDYDLAKNYLTERLKREESVIFYSTHHERYVGFTQLYPVFSSVSAQASWILNDLFVLPEFRRKGIGEKLLIRSKQWVLDDGSKGLALETAINNPAQKLYEKLGWVKDEEYLHYFWQAE